MPQRGRVGLIREGGVLEIYTPYGPQTGKNTQFYLLSPKCPSPFICKDSLLDIISTNSLNQGTPLLPTVDGRLPTFHDIPTFERVMASVFETELRSTNWARTTNKSTVHKCLGALVSSIRQMCPSQRRRLLINMGSMCTTPVRFNTSSLQCLQNDPI